MDWYYSQDGQLVGPVNEDQFNALVRTGVITPKTNVWNKGMAAWQLYQYLAPVAPLSAPVPNPKEAEPDSVQPAVRFDTGDLEKALAKAAAAAKALSAVPTPAPSPNPAGVVVPQEETVPAAPVKPSAASTAVLQEKTFTDSQSFVDAGFGFRLAAAVIDILIYAALFFVILIPLTGSFFISEAVEPGQVFARWEAGLLFMLGLHLAYQTFFTGKYGDTPGKMIFHLKVVRLDGNPLTYRHAFKRGLGEILTGITLGMGYLWAVKDGEKRPLHDRLCATRVIKKA